METVILGLGSNLGKKVENLRQAVSKISANISAAIKISSIYESQALLHLGAPSHWNKSYYNIAIKIKTNLSPLVLLYKLKDIEIFMGRIINSNELWAPRIIDIDILSYGNIVLHHDNLIIPHKGLLLRNFALAPLLEIFPNWHYPNSNINLYLQLKKLPHIKIVPFFINGTKIVGIINIYNNVFKKNLINHKIKMFKKKFVNMIYAGAEIIDIGAESTKPYAESKTSLDNWNILLPYLNAVQEILYCIEFPINVEISIDTYHFQVIERVVKKFDFVSVINDIYGLYSSKIANIINTSNRLIKYIFMHHCGSPATQYSSIDNYYSDILKYAEDKNKLLIKYGMHQDNIIFDLGIGFGKYAFQVRKLLSNIKNIKEFLGIPLMVSHSRKQSVASLFNNVVKYQDIISSIMTYKLCLQNIDYIRVHNVGFNVLGKFIDTLY